MYPSGHQTCNFKFIIFNFAFKVVPGVELLTQLFKSTKIIDKAAWMIYNDFYSRIGFEGNRVIIDFPVV